MPVVRVWQGKGGSHAFIACHQAVEHVFVHQVPCTLKRPSFQVKAIYKQTANPLFMDVFGPLGTKQISRCQLHQKVTKRCGVKDTVMYKLRLTRHKDRRMKTSKAWTLFRGVLAALGAASTLPVGTASAQPTATVTSTTVNLKMDCGAKGDDRSNDTGAFQKAARLIQARGGGTLVIPKATYVVGGQKYVEGQTPYYQTQSVFKVEKLGFLNVKGNGATVRFARGLHYGAFDPQTGQPYDKMPDYDHKYAVPVGAMLDISHSRHVTVRDLDLDGSSGTYVLGGGWGDTGRQLAGEGLLLYGNADVQVSHVHSHHHGLDGMMIGWTGLKESDPPTPHTLTDCAFDFNGRQGLSWVGGRSLQAIRCKFDHTGRVKVGTERLASAPGAGVDIEAEESVCRDGYFQDCEFVDNVGCGLVADSGDGGYAHFLRCTFWGTTNWSAWSARPGLKYRDCNFYGSAVHTFGSPDPALATTFIGCRFEDKPWTDGRVYGTYLLDSDRGGNNVRFDRCAFVVHSPARHPLWFNASHGKALFTDNTGLPR